VTDVPRIDPGGELLGRCQDRWDRLVVILKFPEVLLADWSVIRRYTVAVIWIGAVLHLIYL
jgi:hypothetical protein